MCALCVTMSLSILHAARVPVQLFRSSLSLFLCRHARTHHHHPPSTSLAFPVLLTLGSHIGWCAPSYTRTHNMEPRSEMPTWKKNISVGNPPYGNSDTAQRTFCAFSWEFLILKRTITWTGTQYQNMSFCFLWMKFIDVYLVFVQCTRTRYRLIGYIFVRTLGARLVESELLFSTCMEHMWITKI